MSRHFGLLAFAALVLAACTDPAPAPVARHIDLHAAVGRADLQPIGVAVDTTGTRFFFDEAHGLYRLGADDRATLILPLADMPDPGMVVRPPYTDLVAVGTNRFAITAIGDGYLLDVAARTMQQYFCYLPDGLPPDYDQRTDAITYDPVGDRIYAQPRTFDGAGELMASQLASYLPATGVDLDWQDLPLDTVAGGLVKLPDTAGVVLGIGARLQQWEGRGLVDLADLSAHGITDITGLALDAKAGTLLVVDGPSDAILELPLADL